MSVESDERRREYLQLSAAEVPGFGIRTTIDDVIGKLYAIRRRLMVDVATLCDQLDIEVGDEQHELEAIRAEITRLRSVLEAVER